MPNIPYGDLETPGEDFIKNAAGAVRGAVCQLYHNYRHFYHNSGVGISTPPGKLLENFWNNVCPNEPPYEPPSPQFSGGQCKCQIYLVEVTTSDGTVFGNNCYGVIGGCRIVYNQRPDGFFDAFIQVFCQGTWDNGFSPCLQSPTWVTITLQPKVPDIGQGRITRIVDKFGGADNCGDPPVPPVVAPPEQDLKPNVSFSFGGDQYNIPLSISPQIHVGGRYGFNPDIDLGININAQADIGFEGPQFTFNPEFNLKPQLEFNFGGGGVNVNIGGDTYNNTYSPSSNPALEPSEGEEVEEGEEDKNAKGLRFVKVTLTELPDKVQYGNGDRNVYFAGWIEFLVGNSALPRTQINFEESLFEAPKYSDGYSVTFTNGARGRVTKYTLKG